MNKRGDYKQIKNLHSCFEARVNCIDFVLNLQIQFQAIHCCIFVKKSKSGYQFTCT